MEKNEMKDLILGYLENHPGASNTPSALKEGLALDTEDSRVFRDAMDELQMNIWFSSPRRVNSKTVNRPVSLKEKSPLPETAWVMWTVKTEPR